MMSYISEIKNMKNPYAIPEPYFLPGYTGHCPNYLGTIGQTYGRATHSVMEFFQGLPDRMKPQSTENQDTDLELIQNRKSYGNTFLTGDIAPGYKGHVPRASYQVGLSFNQSCVKGVAEFERKKKRQEELLRHQN